MDFKQLFSRLAQELHRSKTNKKKIWKKNISGIVCILQNEVTQFLPHMILPSRTTKPNTLKDNILSCIFTRHIGRRPSSQIKHYKKRTGSRIIYLFEMISEKRNTCTCQTRTCSQVNSHSLAPSWLVKHGSVAGWAALLSKRGRVLTLALLPQQPDHLLLGVCLLSTSLLITEVQSEALGI